MLMMLKENLKVYLSRFRAYSLVNIKSNFVINIGVDCNITTRGGYDQQLVMSNVNERIKQFFNIDRWKINQPIVLSELQTTNNDVEGVLSVNNITITNDDTYSSVLVIVVIDIT